ncbi:hypothetical protein L7F22_012551 [Adiantum nelumboides]|nr:hypothetical protein [Adiantum nelumboides]
MEGKNRPVFMEEKVNVFGVSVESEKSPGEAVGMQDDLPMLEADVTDIEDSEEPKFYEEDLNVFEDWCGSDRSPREDAVVSSQATDGATDAPCFYSELKDKSNGDPDSGESTAQIATMSDVPEEVMAEEMHREEFVSAEMWCRGKDAEIKRKMEENIVVELERHESGPNNLCVADGYALEGTGHVPRRPLDHQISVVIKLDCAMRVDVCTFSWARDSFLTPTLCGGLYQPTEVQQGGNAVKSLVHAGPSFDNRFSCSRLWNGSVLSLAGGFCIQPVRGWLGLRIQLCLGPEVSPGVNPAGGVCFQPLRGFVKLKVQSQLRLEISSVFSPDGGSCAQPVRGLSKLKFQPCLGPGVGSVFSPRCGASVQPVRRLLNATIQPYLGLHAGSFFSLDSSASAQPMRGLTCGKNQLCFGLDVGVICRPSCWEMRPTVPWRKTAGDRMIAWFNNGNGVLWKRAVSGDWICDQVSGCDALVQKTLCDLRSWGDYGDHMQGAIDRQALACSWMEKRRGYSREASIGDVMTEVYAVDYFGYASGAVTPFADVVFLRRPLCHYGCMSLDSEEPIAEVSLNDTCEEFTLSTPSDNRVLNVSISSEEAGANPFK